MKEAKRDPDELHPEHEEMATVWQRARTVLAGEDAVKDSGDKMLPMLEGQSTDEYAAYKMRAHFFNATARTRSGLCGMIFRKDPAIEDAGEAAMKTFLADVDLRGTSVIEYSKGVVNEVIGIGRAGTLVDWDGDGSDGEQRAFISCYAAENILNWRTSRRGGRPYLSKLVLLETVDGPEGDPVEQLRVLEISGGGLEVTLYQKPGTETGKKEWQKIKAVAPSRKGQPLIDIPFVFHGPVNSLPGVSRGPLDDLVSVNLDHYRIAADYRHGIHFTALPTAWVSGFPTSTVLKIGSTTAWVTDQVGATAGFLEFKGEGLGAIVQALEKDERYMAVLGARLLEDQKKAAEAAETVKIRQGSESSIVGDIANSISESMTAVLRWVRWWHTGGERREDVDGGVRIRLNTDFVAARMTSEDLTALVRAWQAGAISRDTMLYNMRQGELLPPGRTNEQEIEMTETVPPPVEQKAV